MHHSISRLGTCFLIALSITTFTISNASVIPPPTSQSLPSTDIPGHESPTLLAANPYEEAPASPLNHHHREWAEELDHRGERSHSGNEAVSLLAENASNATPKCPHRRRSRLPDQSLGLKWATPSRYSTPV